MGTIHVGDGGTFRPLQEIGGRTVGTPNEFTSVRRVYRREDQNPGGVPDWQFVLHSTIGAPDPAASEAVVIEQPFFEPWVNIFVQNYIAEDNDDFGRHWEVERRPGGMGSFVFYDFLETAPGTVTLFNYGGPEGQELEHDDIIRARSRYRAQTGSHGEWTDWSNELQLVVV